MLSTDEGDHWIESIESLPPGKRIAFRRDTSDLYFDSIDFTIDGVRIEQAIGGIATPTETFVILVDEVGNVTTSYER